MLYKMSNGTVELSGNTILMRADFEIRNKTEKLAVVGRNGCGKTTLLRTIAGELTPIKEDGISSGISVTGNPVIGYLKQLTFEDNSRTLDEEIRLVFQRVLRMKERLSELVEELNAGAGEKTIA